MKNCHNLRQLIREALSEIKPLNESMTLYIQNYDFQPRKDQLLSLCDHLLQEVLRPILNNLPKDQQEYFRKNGIGFYETIVPDGSSSIYSPTGIINFYVSGLMSNSLRQALTGILRELKKLGIQWGPLKKEDSNMFKSQVIRIPIVKNKHIYNGPPEITFSNRNAYHIFHEVLQYPGEHTFTMNAQELKQRIDLAFGDKNWIEKHQISDKHIEPVAPEDKWKDETPVSDNPGDQAFQDLSNKGGMNIYSFGLNDQAIRDRLYAIWQFADWAIKHGFTELYVA